MQKEDLQSEATKARNLLAVANMTNAMEKISIIAPTPMTAGCRLPFGCAKLDVTPDGGSPAGILDISVFGGSCKAIFERELDDHGASYSLAFVMGKKVY